MFSKINLLGVIITIFAIIIIKVCICDLYGLLSKSYTKKIKQYKITKLSYLYFIYDSLAGIIFAVFAVLYYVLSLNHIVTVFSDTLANIYWISLMIFGIGRLLNPYIDKHYLIK